MTKWEVVVDVTGPREVAAFAKWIDRWRDQVVVSEKEGCGCCVDIWKIEGPAEAQTELAAQLVGDAR
jgi:hypothetical protein